MINLPPRLGKLKETVVDFFFPRWCIGCGKTGDFLCPDCREGLTRLKSPVCPRCGRPQPPGNTCPSCQRWSAKIDGIRAPFKFEGVIRQVVHQFKYQNVTALAQPLAGLVYDYLAHNPIPGDVLVPVPLHPSRLRERGYNQSALLARELAKLGNLSVLEDCLVRKRRAIPQARTITVEERRINVSGAFSATEAISGRRVLLIDDVSTSGATLDACAAALKAAGAVSVWGLTLAREI